MFPTGVARASAWVGGMSQVRRGHLHRSERPAFVSQSAFPGCERHHPAWWIKHHERLRLVGLHAYGRPLRRLSATFGAQTSDPTVERARRLKAGDLTVANGNGEQLAPVDAANSDATADKLLLTASDF